MKKDLSCSACFDRNIVLTVINPKAVSCLMSVLYLVLMIPAAARPAEYDTISTPYYDFFFTHYDREAVEVLAEDSSAMTESVMSDLGVTLTRKVSVYIPDRGGFQNAQPSKTVFPESVLGTAYHNLSLMVLKSPRAVSSTSVNLRKTFIHELTHILLGQAFTRDNHVPRWLNEGVAMYESREWSFDRVVTMTQAVLTDSLLPLADLTHAFPHDKKNLELAYCQSFYLISFLVSQYGTQQFHSFIRSYSKEKVLEDVLLNIYGMNLYELERRWHRTLKMRFSWIPLITSSITLWFIITVIFLCSYLRKKRNVQLTLKNWEEEPE
jgi:hypothetical protein